jgi:hypothetical protein
MARTDRTDKQRTADRATLAKEKAASDRKIKESMLKGESFYCESREQQILEPICVKVQGTAGCKATDCCLWDAKLNLKAETQPGTKKKSKGSGKLSYQAIMKAHFIETGFATLPALVDLINDHPSRKSVERAADLKNVSVGISILKNSKRVKNPLRIDFSRKTKLYYYLDFEGISEIQKADLADYEANKPAEKTADPAPEEKTEAIDYSGYKLKGLRDLAKTAKIKGYSGMTKANLIKALTA